MRVHDQRIREWAVPERYTAGRYLDIPPIRAVYPGRDEIDGKDLVVGVATVLLDRNTNWNGIYCGIYPIG